MGTSTMERVNAMVRDCQIRDMPCDPEAGRAQVERIIESAILCFGETITHADVSYKVPHDVMLYGFSNKEGEILGSIAYPNAKYVSPCFTMMFYGFVPICDERGITAHWNEDF
jgi:hypothetical protein